MEKETVRRRRRKADNLAVADMKRFVKKDEFSSSSEKKQKSVQFIPDSLSFWKWSEWKAKLRIG